MPPEREGRDLHCIGEMVEDVFHLLWRFSIAQLVGNQEYVEETYERTYISWHLLQNNANIDSSGYGAMG